MRTLSIYRALMLLGFFFLSVQGHAEDRLHSVLRAFIPNALENAPQYIKPIPSRPNQFMIEDPLHRKTCFATDHQSFSSDFSAPARLMTEFVLVVKVDKASIEKVGGKDYHRCGPSEKLTVDGDHVTATITKRASLKTNAMGTPIFANSMAQVIGQAAASNPFLLSPWVDYSFDIVFKPTSKELVIKMNVGAFPAFEGYVTLNDGPKKTLFKAKPSISNVGGLFELILSTLKCDNWA